MNLDLVNNLAKNIKNHKLIQNFIKELQNYLEKDKSQNNEIDAEKEERTLLHFNDNEIKITVKFRDKMYLERSHILNDYAKQTLDKGEMYYIYSKNSKRKDYYNLCICEEGKSHTIMEESKDNLPNGAIVGSVLRKKGTTYLLDEKASDDISKQIENIKFQILEEQNAFLESKRIEGHIYEISENDGDSAWLFDITNGSTEGFQEIDFPIDLLKVIREGDLLIYQNGEYQKYLLIK